MVRRIARVVVIRRSAGRLRAEEQGRRKEGKGKRTGDCRRGS